MAEYQKEKSALNYSMPDFDIAEKDKDEEWFTQSLRYFSTFYNKLYNIYSIDNPDENLNPVDRGMRNSLYYLGKQRNIDYAHMTQDLSGNNLQAVWIKGKKVRQLVSHLVGNLINQLENKDITALTLSREAISRKSKMYDDLMFKYDSQALELFKQLESIGVQYTPAGNKQFESQEQVKRFMEQDWKETSEVVAIDIAKDIEQKNDAETLYIQAFLEYCAAGYCAIHNYVDNGNIKQVKIPFYNLIWDLDKHDPFTRNSKFKGFIERLTPQEIFSKFPKYFNNNKEARKEVEKMVANQQYARNIFDYYNTTTFTWWNYDRDKQIGVCAVTMYWINRRDIRYEKTKDNFGNEHFQRVKKESKKGQYFVDDIYYATLVGNRYLVEWGLADNVVRKAGDKGMPEMPIQIIADNTTLGDGVPIIGMVAQSQDRIDFYRFKIMEMIAKDKGKNYIINGNKLGESIKTRELVADFASMGVHVTPGTSGESDDPTNAQRMVEFVDLTFDPNVMRYVELYREEERIMEEIMNIPKIALGQQQTYIGLGTQKGTITQSTLGLSLVFRNFVKFNELNLQYATNLAKIIYTEDSNEDAPLIVGDRGIKFLKITKDMRFEDLLVFVKTKDVVDEQAKQRILSYAQAWSQNPAFGVDPLDILKLEQAATFTEMINELEYSIKEKKKQAMQMAQQQAQMAQQEQAKELGTKMDITKMKEDGATGRQNIQSQTELGKTMIKEGNKNPTANLPINK